MKIKVSEATGPVLDWMVAKAEDYYDSMLNVKTGVVYGLVGLLEFSTNWSQGGPIIERERMVVAAEEFEWVANLNHTRMVEYTTGAAMRYCTMRGPTPLIAAMRCYVASKLGDEVEVPDELA